MKRTLLALAMVLCLCATAGATEFVYKVVPEIELERWLNNGWELVKVFTVEEPTHSITGVTFVKPVSILVNKAVIRIVPGVQFRGGDDMYRYNTWPPPKPYTPEARW